MEDRADISINKNLPTCEMEKIRHGLAKNKQFFYYYENKADSCKDHQFRYDEFYRMKKSARLSSPSR